MTKEIELTRGYTAIIDNDDFSDVSKHSWCIHVNKCGVFYGQCTIKNKRYLLHINGILGLRCPRFFQELLFLMPFYEEQDDDFEVEEEEEE